MNILMFNYEYPPLGGGGGVINKLLAEELGKQHKVTVITSQFGQLPVYEQRLPNVEIHRVPILMRGNQNWASLPSMLSFFPMSLRTGSRLLRQRSFDLIHSMFAIPSAPSGYLLAKRFRKPHVLSLLGGDVYDPSKMLSPHRTPILRSTVKQMIKRSDAVIGMSSDVVKRAVEHYDVCRPIDVIPHAIKRPRFTPKTRDALGFKSGDTLLVTVGRLVPRKAVHELIQAVRDLDDPRVQLLIVGDGPERAKLERCAQASEVASQIHFLGNVSDEAKFQLLNIADLYVSSTQHEGFGLVFLEAMSVGLPVVCYDNGGQVDFLRDEQTGFLVELDQHAMLTQRIGLLCEQVERRRQMGAWNQRYVENFYIESCAQNYQQVYESLAQPSSSLSLV
jgi:L-malate glycosyltransferase